MDDELICNYKKCRKRLDTCCAWVTTCSHIFCEADGTKVFSTSHVCPACDTNLPNKYDIVKLDLRPPEHVKALALCGLKPDIILEICTRAINFWNYQMHQEKTYQEYLASKAREKSGQLEQYYEQVVARLQADITSAKSKIEMTKKKLEQYEAKCKEFNGKLQEKTKQYIKLQSLYEALRRRCVTPATFYDQAGANVMRDCTAQTSLLMNFSAREDVLGPAHCSRGVSGVPAHCAPTHSEARITGPRCTPHHGSPPQREFMFHPNATPLAGDSVGLPRFPAEGRLL